MEELKSRRGRPQKVGTIALLTTGAIVCFSLGAAGVAFALGNYEPTSLRPSASIDVVPTEGVAFADERSVELKLTQSPPVVLTIRGAGVVTSNSCISGTAISSGQIAYSVDDAPVVALATSSPMWRDLRPGDRGVDVEAFQTALANLGTGIQVDGVLGYDALEAFANLLVNSGYPKEEFTSIPSARILWIPGPETTPSSCEVSVGEQIAETAEYATVSGGLVSASISTVSEGPLPGARAVSINGSDIPVEESGTITAPEHLATIATLPGFNDAIRATDPVPLSGTWHLVEPIEAVSVPASGLTRLESGSACIWDEDEGFPVLILGSQLGQTLVQSATETPLPDSISIRHHDTHTDCKS